MLVHGILLLGISLSFSESLPVVPILCPALDRGPVSKVPSPETQHNDSATSQSCTFPFYLQGRGEDQAVNCSTKTKSG